MITTSPLTPARPAMMIAISHKPTFVTMAASAQKATIQTLMLVRLPSASCNDMEQGNKRC